MKTTWHQKLHNTKNSLPEIKEIVNEGLLKQTGPGKMVIPNPLEIDVLMRSVPEGLVITTDDIRKQQNAKYDAVYTCPLCTGIFSKITAYASVEVDNETAMNPYWRTLKTKGEINEKFPGGIEKQIELLEKEGHSIIAKGKKFFVKDYETALFRLIY